MDVDAVLGAMYELIAPHLTEKQRRLLAGDGQAPVVRRGRFAVRDSISI